MLFTNAEKDAIALVAEEEAKRDVPRRIFPIAGRHGEVLRTLAPKQVAEVLDYAYGDPGKAKGAAKIDGGCVPLAEGLREGRDFYEGWLKYILGDERYKTLCDMDAEVAFLENPATQAQRLTDGGVVLADGGSAYAVRDRLYNIPAEVLPASQRHVLLDMATHTNRATGECFPSIDTLARDTGQSKRQVIRSISNMRDAGILKVGKRKTRDGLGNRYTITLPKHPREFTPEETAVGDCMSPTKTTDRQEGDIPETQKVTFQTVEGDRMSPERKIKKETKERNGVVVNARARVGTPAAASSLASDEDEVELIISQTAKDLGDISPNRPAWREGIRLLGRRGFEYVAAQAKKEARTNPGALLTLKLASVDVATVKKEYDRIDAEKHRELERRFAFWCQNSGCENYNIEPDVNGSHCKVLWKPPRVDANSEECPRYKKAAAGEMPKNPAAAFTERPERDLGF